MCSLCDANSTSASQEIARVLWDLKIHCRVYSSVPFVSILSQVTAVVPSHPVYLSFGEAIFFHLCLDLPSWLCTLGVLTK
jgi:hypothetical protein